MNRTLVYISMLVIGLALGISATYSYLAQHPSLVTKNAVTSPSPTATPTPAVAVTSPSTGITVSNPLVLSGSAKGNWYFEGQFKARLLDADGKELGSTAVKANGDWTANAEVPFTGTISYSQPATDTGTLEFQNDNPSGLPQNSVVIKTAVRFR